MNASDAPERDPALARAWRAHSREAPPAELDRAILAAAHRAVDSGPQEVSKSGSEATRPQRWWMPLAAAAAIGVVTIGILQLTSPEQSLVAPNERVAAVAQRGAEEKAPAPAVGQSASDAMKERDAPAPATRNDVAGLEQKRKQETPPAAPVSPSPQKPAPPIERGPPVVTGKLAARAPEPQPFPGATDARKNVAADTKRDALADGAAKAAETVAPAPAAPPQPPPAAMAEERAASRKDASAERQQAAAATDKTTAGAQPGRSGPAPEGAVSSFAAAPAPLVASPRARESGLARNEAPAQAAPAASPPTVTARKVAPTDELRAKARDPDAWIVRIRKLRDEGHAAEALRELRDFRDLVPDAERRLPADLLSWANTVKP